FDGSWRGWRCRYSATSAANTSVAAAEGSIGVRILGAEPVAESASRQRSRRHRRRTFHHEVVAVEEIGGVLGVRRQRLESLERTERCRRPFPAVSEQIVDAERACRLRVRTNRFWIPAMKVEVARDDLGKHIAPWIESLVPF